MLIYWCIYQLIWQFDSSAMYVQLTLCVDWGIWIWKMAEYVAAPSCIKLHMQSTYINKRECLLRNSYFRPAQRFYCRTCLLHFRLIFFGALRMGMGIASLNNHSWFLIKFQFFEEIILSWSLLLIIFCGTFIIYQMHTYWWNCENHREYSFESFVLIFLWLQNLENFVCPYLAQLSCASGPK